MVHLDEIIGMGGTLHAWEKLGDGVAPDIQAVAKGLGGGYVNVLIALMNSRKQPNSFSQVRVNRRCSNV